MKLDSAGRGKHTLYSFMGFYNDAINTLQNGKYLLKLYAAIIIVFFSF